MRKPKEAGLGRSPLSAEVEGFDSLAVLALDMRWTWNHSDDEVWKGLDPALWDLTHNPWLILQTVSRDRLRSVLGDPAFRKKVEVRLKARRKALGSTARWEQAHPGSALTSVVYFSMEFMLSEAMPIYSGGLGNVAGDQLKAASDLGVPVTGVGLLYQQGYFRQVIDKNGDQHALFPYNDPGQLPIMPLREPNGEWLRLKVAFPGCTVWLRTWQVRVGRVKLYLLDSNDPANVPSHRGITGELYGGGPELRLMQEKVLGIGGWRLLEALGIRPEVCHLNEGHAAFAVLERARSFMEMTGKPFQAALAATRAGNVFTTHTPVPAGFDLFAPSLMEKYLGKYASIRLGISMQEFLALGRRDPEDAAEPFNMAYLAVRGSGAVNGVSRLHGEVSRRIFQPLFPRWPQAEVPIGHVTNGVHESTWDSAEANALWTEACGKDRWLGPVEVLEERMRRVPDSLFWQFRSAARASLVEFARKRMLQQLAISGASPKETENAKCMFDPNALMLGFARRFATYKRPALLLDDPERLIRILSDPRRPVQLIVAGKAHPSDLAGQAMIKRWMEFIGRPEVRGRVAFLGDYDMHLTKRLISGVDVWINTPRRPWEACGTSGMKVLVNGGLNLSELDGWWAEAYAPEVGWALGDGREHGADPEWDAAEATALYDILENSVIPAFYTRNSKDIPAGWISLVRESMARLAPRFSAGRAVQDYTEKYYIPAAEAYKTRAAKDGEPAAEMAERLLRLERQWSELRFGGLEVRTDTKAGRHLFAVEVQFGGLDPDSVRVEIYAEPEESAIPGTFGPVRQEMARGAQLQGVEAGYLYNGSVPASRPSGDYTVRAVPALAGISVPLEANRILWQK